MILCWVQADEEDPKRIAFRVDRDWDYSLRERLRTGRCGG